MNIEELVRTSMKELARDLEPAVPNPAALRARVNRTRRLRSVAAIGLAAAAATAVVVGVSELRKSDSSGPVRQEQIGQSTARPLTYAEGATLHFGDQDVAMPSNVLEIDMVDGGAVVRTEDGGIWLTDGTAPEQIGTLGTPAKPFKPDLPFYYGDGVGFVVSNNAGSQVGWFEFPQPDQPELVVYDAETGEETARLPIEVKAGSGAVLTSVSDQYAYWDVDPVPYEDPASEGRIDLATGEQITVTTAAEGVQPPPPGTHRTVLTSHQEGGGPPFEVDDGIHMQLGWDRGTDWISSRGEAPEEVRDGATRELFRFAAPPGYSNPDPVPGWLTQWIDDDTIVITYQDYRGKQLSDLLVCHVSSHSCEVAAQSVDAVLPEIG
jgi:hypothetical protein